MIEMHFNLNELTKLSDDMLAAAKRNSPGRRRHSWAGPGIE